jgi:hypothetical protein
MVNTAGISIISPGGGCKFALLINRSRFQVLFLISVNSCFVVKLEIVASVINCIYVCIHSPKQLATAPVGALFIFQERHHTS